MSASIYWRPAGDATLLYTMAPQRFLDALGELGITDTVDDSHIQALRALAKLDGSPDTKNPYMQLARAVETHGAVLLTVEY